MRTRPLSSLLSVIAFTTLAACGGSQPAPETPSASAPDAAAPMTEAPAPAQSAAPAATAEVDAGAPVASVDAGPPAQKSWADMSHDERLALMKSTVMPKMKDAFQGFDAKDYADFSCKTCHGEGVKKGKFDMPNPKLPKLDAKAGFKKMKAKHPAAMKFMMETVAPNMASILGLPEWSQSNPTGFGCGNCHTME